MKIILNFLTMIFFVFFFISCEKQYKKKNSYESLNEKKQNVEVSNKMTFNEANKLCQIMLWNINIIGIKMRMALTVGYWL